MTIIRNSKGNYLYINGKEWWFDTSECSIFKSIDNASDKLRSLGLEPDNYSFIEV